ncbi:hypothetical protein GMORB2_4477 [Geosmithia morbida]|uniref:DUF4604 domain-containing protein n=1 Tax=Geosmithia morbida TaxID=1094350 RepID=A0A9P4YMR1_9HYPO|nr:uncharacterized protein GMORB2_4477 [Geosmithia morbida]KAF4119811.1 hypothetical protein GMORB2_4477 [Geosmithia morbida]
MSQKNQKVTSKNLSFNKSLPPFLAALHAQAGGGGRGEPSPGGQRRSAKKRPSSEEAEDVPLVVDEDGNVVDVEVDKDGVVREDGGDAVARDDEKGTSKDPETSSKAAIGGRKRKVGRVVGEDAAVGTTEEEDKPKKPKGASDGGKDEANNEEVVKDKRPKKKAKKIKLSFDDEEG